tara:strand:- start:182 stop:403 length:222 start_codon:yes stop_codon:yes gene_type:complete
MTTQYPDAPVKAVVTIFKTFRGVEEIGGTDGWLVTFQSDSDEQNATLLINRLQGWEAEPHPNILNMIRIQPES